MGRGIKKGGGKLSSVASPDRGRYRGSAVDVPGSVNPGFLSVDSCLRGFCCGCTGAGRSDNSVFCLWIRASVDFAAGILVRPSDFLSWPSWIVLSGSGLGLGVLDFGIAFADLSDPPSFALKVAAVTS